MPSLKIDMHIHTKYSEDSLIDPKDAIKWAQYRKMDGIVICDHDTLKGYRIIKKFVNNDDLIVIPAMEVKTHIGEVIGLFIEDEINTKKNNFFEIIDDIKDKNGLVLVPHPFDFLRGNHLKINRLKAEMISKCLDGIEIINSRIIIPYCMKKARTFNEQYNLFETGGSDAHTKREIGRGYTLINEVLETSLESVRKSLLAKKTESKGKLSNPLVHLITVMNKLKKGSYF